MNELKRHANSGRAAGMARFGIDPRNAWGIPIPVLRRLAAKTGKNNALSLALWDTGIHEARILASLVGEPTEITSRQMDRWARQFDAWDICDQCCSNLFDKTPRAYSKASAWSRQREEFVKRAGFALMAVLAVHDKTAPDDRFIPFLDRVEKESSDPRNFVKKAVNWALRQIGKRNRHLHEKAKGVARRLINKPDAGSRWIGRDAWRELTSTPVLRRLRLKTGAERK